MWNGLNKLLLPVLQSANMSTQRPILRRNFESNVDGLYIIGDLAGAPVVKLAMEQGNDVAEHITAQTHARSAGPNIDANKYDLVVIGALGTGAVKESLLGSVCERTVRRIRTDTVVVKDTRPLSEQQGPILVAIDGSPFSYGGLKTAIGLSKSLKRPIEAVGAHRVNGSSKPRPPRLACSHSASLGRR